MREENRHLTKNKNAMDNRDTANSATLVEAVPMCVCIMASTYDPRPQVVSASVSTNAYGYSYDSVGNSIHASRNAATNYYLSNELNQYSSILRVKSAAEPLYS